MGLKQLGLSSATYHPNGWLGQQTANHDQFFRSNYNQALNAVTSVSQHDTFSTRLNNCIARRKAAILKASRIMREQE